MFALLRRLFPLLFPPLFPPLFCLLLLIGVHGAWATPLEPSTRRIVFLGDSITFSGEFVDFFEAFLYRDLPTRSFEVINLGLPNETVSGLSEPGHAGGHFARPALGDRLGRILQQTRPQLVIACYGMNDGLFEPPDAARFAHFKKGIRDMRAAVRGAGARLILLTPPPFDADARTLSRAGFNYDATLSLYSSWLLAQRARGWSVLDVHGALQHELTARRRDSPRFRLSPDGVHPNAAGHWIIARTLLRAFTPQPEAFAPDARDQKRLRLIHERGRILGNAWLSQIGHSRPGMKPGLPLNEAQSRASQIEAQIRIYTAARTQP